MVMGAMSRDKGKAGEREVAREISLLTGWNVRRKVRQLDGESDLEGVPGWSVEVKRHAVALPGDIAAWWKQAHDQAVSSGPAEVPVLFFRANGRKWRAVFPLSIVMGRAPQDQPGYEWSCEVGLEAWAAIARERYAG
jgi:hypothetical protein